MTSTRKIIRVFLASPGDLQEERKAIREVVDEFNQSWSNELGYQVELIGWEETVAGFGRPQHLINQDLDRCDLFLGMMWKRWGTPPDRDGEFSSGFEEEFERSMSRCEETGSPEISLFFKRIPEEFMVDPGDDLKKVLEFRESIIADKKILFQSFSTVRIMETLARKSITAYVNRVKAEEESSEADDLGVKRARSSSEKAAEGDLGGESSPLSAKGFEFLEDLVSRIRQPDSLDNLSASDVARFRLLANSISQPGNDEMDLGVHDINLLFATRTKGVELGAREIRSLARLGFQHLANENVPLWCWYLALEESRFDFAVVSAFGGANEKEKVGAISLLTALALDLPTNDDPIRRDWILNSWFSGDSPVRVRTSALAYLAKCGTVGDLEIARKEYGRSDHGTSRDALECMVEIHLRTGHVKAAQALLLESQFETINPDLLKSALVGLESLENSALLLGLEHRNSQVRLGSMKALHSRGALDIGMVERLTVDRDAQVRNAAIAVLLEFGKSLTEAEIKKILVLPQKQTGPRGRGLLGIAAVPDDAGQELFEQYRLGVLKSLSESELEKRVGMGLMYDEAEYFALIEKYFKNHADELRRDIDDRFGAYFEERLRRLKATFGDDSASLDLVKRVKDLEEFLRKKLTRKGLDILCVAQKSEDLQRIRANLRDGYAEASKLDAEYLGKRGEWTDIPMLVNAQVSIRGAILQKRPQAEDFQLEVARAITSIGKRHSISDLLSLEMPAAILKKTIEVCTESRFARISKDTLFALFNHESDGVRKAAAVLTVRALPAKRIKSLLREYVDNDKYRYYNVIHWLDLGASMSRDDAKKVARVVGS